MNIAGLQTVEAGGPYFDYGLTYMKGQKPLVTFGSVAVENLQKADVDGKVFFATFDWDLVTKAIRPPRKAGLSIRVDAFDIHWPVSTNLTL